MRRQQRPFLRERDKGRDRLLPFQRCIGCFLTGPKLIDFALRPEPADEHVLRIGLELQRPLVFRRLALPLDRHFEFHRTSLRASAEDRKTAAVRPGGGKEEIVRGNPLGFDFDDLDRFDQSSL